MKVIVNSVLVQVIVNSMLVQVNLLTTVLNDSPVLPEEDDTPSMYKAIKERDFALSKYLRSLKKKISASVVFYI